MQDVVQAENIGYYECPLDRRLVHAAANRKFPIRLETPPQLANIHHTTNYGRQIHAPIKSSS